MSQIALISHAIYLSVSLIFTIAVGHSLYKNGRVFLLESFHGDAFKADSVNRLLLTGFYLLNFGMVLLMINVYGWPSSVIDCVEQLSTKFGLVMIVLGVSHMFNMKNLAGMSSRARAKVQKESVA